MVRLPGGDELLEDQELVGVALGAGGGFTCGRERGGEGSGV